MNSAVLVRHCAGPGGRFRDARRWLITGVRLMPPSAEQEQAARRPDATEALLGLIVLRALAGGPYGARTAVLPSAGCWPVPRRHEASALGRVTRSRESGVSVLSPGTPGERTTPWSRNDLTAFSRASAPTPGAGTSRTPSRTPPLNSGSSRLPGRRSSRGWPPLSRTPRSRALSPAGAARRCSSPRPTVLCRPARSRYSC